MNNDLKDVILQTLEELEDEKEIINDENIDENRCNEKIDTQFLYKLRNKFLVLFEGLQSPNIVDVEKKLDLTINFLEYTLAMIDKKIDETKRDN